MPDAMIDIIRDQNELPAHQYSFTLWPVRWATYTDLHNWELTKLIPGCRSSVPNCSGIYTLVAQPGIARHPRLFLPDVRRAIHILAQSIWRLLEQGANGLRTPQDLPVSSHVL